MSLKQQQRIFFGPRDPWKEERPTDEERRRAVSSDNPKSAFSRIRGNELALRMFQDAAFVALGRFNHVCQEQAFVLLGDGKREKQALAHAFAETVQLPFIQIGMESVRASDDFLTTVDQMLTSDGLPLVEEVRKDFILPPCLIYLQDSTTVADGLADDLLDAMDEEESQASGQPMLTDSGDTVNCANVCWIVESAEASIPVFCRTNRWVYLFVNSQSETTEAKCAASLSGEPMAYLPRRKLCELLVQHGRTLADDARRLKALLHDYCPDHRRETRVLLEVLKAGVVAELGNANLTLPLIMLLARLTGRLSHNLVMPEGAVRWAVESWVIALELSKDAPATPAVVTPNALHALVADDVADENGDEDRPQRVEAHCPYCDHENAFEDQGENKCEQCERQFECDADGDIHFGILSRCPNCGEMQTFDDPSDSGIGEYTNDYRNTWSVDCHFCHSAFVIDADGEMLHNYSIEANCPHCGNEFSVPEPANEPFEVICPNCNEQLIGLSTRQFEKGTIPDTWKKVYEHSPNLWIEPHCSPVYSHDGEVDASTLEYLIKWLAVRRDRINTTLYERALTLLQVAIRKNEHTQES